MELIKGRIRETFFKMVRCKFEVVPKHLCREGVSPSLSLSHVAIPYGKPFHPPCPRYGSEDKIFGGKCSDKGVLKVHRSFWDDLFEKEYLEITGLSDKSTLNGFTEQKRNELFPHAYKYNRYYHRVFKQIGLIQSGEIDASKTPDISISTKDIIRKNHTELISDYQTRKWFYNSSGGSIKSKYEAESILNQVLMPDLATTSSLRTPTRGFSG